MPPERERAVTVEVASTLDDGYRSDVVVLLAAAQAVDGYPSLSDRARLCLDDGADAGRVLLGARVGEAAGLAGFSILVRSADGWVLETAVPPEHRAQDVYAALVDAALREVAARGGGRFAAWHRGADDGGVEAFERAGMEAERVLLHLRAPLTAQALGGHAGVEVRPFRPGRDEEAWLEVNRRAFAGHPEQGAWTRADLERREEEPWFDPGGFLIYEVDGRIAAFCWTKVHREPPLGEIYVIGVDPDFWGRGLGRALTLAGLEHLAMQGVRTAMLYVEATNAAALALYRSLGFHEHHREVLFHAEVAGQAETPTARPMP